MVFDRSIPMVFRKAKRIPPDHVSYESLRQHCVEERHRIMWQVAKPADFVTNENLTQNPHQYGPLTMLVKAFLKTPKEPPTESRYMAVLHYLDAIEAGLLNQSPSSDAITEEQVFGMVGHWMSRSSRFVHELSTQFRKRSILLAGREWFAALVNDSAEMHSFVMDQNTKEIFEMIADRLYYIWETCDGR